MKNFVGANPLRATVVIMIFMLILTCFIGAALNTFGKQRVKAYPVIIVTPIPDKTGK